MNDHDQRWLRVGQAIEARRKELKLTKAELIRESGVSDKTLTGYLEGQPIVREDKARGLSRALRWPEDAIDQLLDDGEVIVAANRDPHIDPLVELRLLSLEARVAELEAGRSPATPTNLDPFEADEFELAAQSDDPAAAPAAVAKARKRHRPSPDPESPHE